MSQEEKEPDSKLVVDSSLICSQLPMSCLVEAPASVPNQHPSPGASNRHNPNASPMPPPLNSNDLPPVTLHGPPPVSSNIQLPSTSKSPPPPTAEETLLAQKPNVQVSQKKKSSDSKPLKSAMKHENGDIRRENLKTVSFLESLSVGQLEELELEESTLGNIRKTPKPGAVTRGKARERKGKKGK